MSEERSTLLFLILGLMLLINLMDESLEEKVEEFFVALFFIIPQI